MMRSFDQSSPVLNLFIPAKLVVLHFGLDSCHTKFHWFLIGMCDYLLFIGYMVGFLVVLFLFWSDCHSLIFGSAGEWGSEVLWWKLPHHFLLREVLGRVPGDGQPWIQGLFWELTIWLNHLLLSLESKNDILQLLVSHDLVVPALLHLQLPQTHL